MADPAPDSMWFLPHHSLTTGMESSTSKKPQKPKKSRIKAQERFAKKFPYRFSWPVEHSSEPLPDWEAKNTSPKDQLPLQKTLVPTRSIPVPEVEAPSFTPPSSSPPPVLYSLWELKLRNLRFPKTSDTLST
ncbi:uncharacterized protein C3orf22 homolog isoform 1-T5 [Thomomys bottae]